MAQMPMPPTPMLDGVPPSNPSLGASPNPNPPIGQLAPNSGSAGMQGSMQVVQLSLQAASQAASLIDLLGQINPSFSATAGMLIEQLRGGLKSALQQGSQGSEPLNSGSNPLAQASAQPTPSVVQQPLPPMSSGFGQQQ